MSLSSSSKPSKSPSLLAKISGYTASFLTSNWTPKPRAESAPNPDTKTSAYFLSPSQINEARPHSMTETKILTKSNPGYLLTFKVLLMRYTNAKSFLQTKIPMNLKEIEPRNDIIVITDRTPSRNKIRSFYKWYANRPVSLVENIRNEMKTIKEEIAKEMDKIYPKLSENEFKNLISDIFKEMKKNSISPKFLADILGQKKYFPIIVEEVLSLNRERLQKA